MTAPCGTLRSRAGFLPIPGLYGKKEGGLTRIFFCLTFFSIRDATHLNAQEEQAMESTKKSRPWMQMAAGLALLLVSRPCNATTIFTEDFESGWSSGTLSSSSQLNGWTFRTPDQYAIVDLGSPGNNAIQAVSSPPMAWITAGKALGGTIGTEAMLQFSASQFNFSSQGVVWLADANQNGYGVYFLRGNLNQAYLAKMQGSTNAFGGVPNITNSTSSNFGQRSSPVSVGNQFNDFITYNLKLTQTSAGQPVNLTFWTTGSNANNTTLASPALSLTDNGTGSVFQGTGVVFGPAIDLSTLSRVGMTLIGNTGDVSSSYSRVDLIAVAVPEPSTVMLLGVTGIVAGLTVLHRAKRRRDSAAAEAGARGTAT